MQNIQLGWQPSAVLSAALFAGAAAAGRLRSSPMVRAEPYLRESAIVAALYGLWQLAGSVSVLGTAGAFSRGRTILGWERSWRLPSELSTQRLITGRPLLEQGANWYYAAMHFTALGAILLWLFIRHRERYRGVRNVVVLLTASSVAIQLIPVAPPRLLPRSGFVDTAARFGESVYNVSGISVDQLAAMPSVHVGWSLLVAWSVLGISRSRYRWAVLVHPALTAFVVVATATHFWLDGIVAAVLLVASISVVRWVPGLRAAPSAASAASAPAGMDDGHPGGGAGAHGLQGISDPVQADRGGDQLVGPDGTGTD